MTRDNLDRPKFVQDGQPYHVYSEFKTWLFSWRVGVQTNSRILTTLISFLLTISFIFATVLFAWHLLEIGEHRPKPEPPPPIPAPNPQPPPNPVPRPEPSPIPAPSPTPNADPVPPSLPIQTPTVPKNPISGAPNKSDIGRDISSYISEIELRYQKSGRNVRISTGTIETNVAGNNVYSCRITISAIEIIQDRRIFIKNENASTSSGASFVGACRSAVDKILFDL